MSLMWKGFSLRDAGQHVLDVDHADDIVERLAVDRHSGEWASSDAWISAGSCQCAIIDRHDVGARHHDVVHGTCRAASGHWRGAPARPRRSIASASRRSSISSSMVSRSVVSPRPPRIVLTSREIAGEGLLVGPVFTGRSTAGYVCHCHVGWSVVAPSAPVSPWRQRPGRVGGVGIGDAHAGEDTAFPVFPCGRRRRRIGGHNRAGAECHERPDA